MPLTLFVCSYCDAQFPKWSGKCLECGKWGTLKETSKRTGSAVEQVPAGTPVQLHDLTNEPLVRLPTGSGEFNRVLGGGFVPGSLVLLGGDPGIGKSTLALETAHHVATGGQKVLYVSGEESAAQVATRLKRVAPTGSRLDFLAATDLETVLATMKAHQPVLLVIDSIQTVTVAQAEGEPGSVQQIRAVADLLLQAAKTENIACLMVGHVTKDGVMAGPRALEHLVDTVVYLEGDPLSSYRLLRAVKNRFGSTNDTGVFMMSEHGLRDVAEPSRVFLADRHDGPGTVATLVLEGSRPFAVDVQALTAATAFGNPRRTALGVDLNRLQLLIAVLTRRAGLKSLAAQDVYVNIVGGLGIRERAIDAAVALAIASSVSDRPVPSTTAVLGEIGLGGEIRRVNDIERRVAELERLGFKTIYLPKQALTKKFNSVTLKPITTVTDLVALVRKA